jgi:hypothetical protein
MPTRDMMAMAKTLFRKPRCSQMGINKSAKADPKVPGALGARPEPKPTPLKTISRSIHDMALKLIAGLCKMLIPIKLK